MMQISKLDSMYVTYNLFTEPMYAWRYQSKFKTNLKVHYSNMKDCKNENSQRMWHAALWEENRGSTNYSWEPTWIGISARSQLLKKSKDEVSSSCPKFVSLLVAAAKSQFLWSYKLFAPPLFPSHSVFTLKHLLFIAYVGGLGKKYHFLELNTWYVT